MGNQSFKRVAETVLEPGHERASRLSYVGRYHRPPRLLEEDYAVESTVLGRGASGKVLLANSRTTGARFAVKTLRFDGASVKVKEDVKREAEVFLGMDHPRIARLMDVYEGASHLTLVMECMEGGELFDRVVDRGVYSEKDAAYAVWQMLLALNYLHSHGVVHRDVKLENFMYQKKDSDELKLIDFGFAKVWESKKKLAASCGTLAYVAPEVLEKSYTSQCDNWSLGVVAFILLAGYMPFSGTDSQQIVQISSGMYDMDQPQWKHVSEPAQDLVKKLLVVEPTERLTAEQALHHPWIAQRDQLQAATHAVDRGVVDALRKFSQASKFRRACMSVMAWSLTYDERLSVRDAFLELDQNRQGTITLWELKNVLEARFGVKDEEVKQVFEALDTNHDHEIHYSEFLAAMASSRIALHDDLLRATFRRFDVDGNGHVTRDHLQEVLGESFGGTEVQEFMKEIDRNCDGHISYEEFIEYLRGDDAHDTHVEAANRFIDSKLQGQQQPPDRGARPRSEPGAAGEEEEPAKKLCRRAADGEDGGAAQATDKVTCTA